MCALESKDKFTMTHKKWWCRVVDAMLLHTIYINLWTAISDYEQARGMWGVSNSWNDKIL